MCDAKIMKGGSLASDMVMERLKDASGMPYDFLPTQPKQGDLSVLTEYQLTGGARRKSGKSKKSMKSSKKGCGCGMTGGSWGKKMNKKSTKSAKSSKKSKKSKKSMSKSRKMMHKKMLGGGSDFVTTLYSQGPINNPGDYSGSFSVSQPSPKGMLMNPPNLASAGSGYPMCYFSGAGAPY